MALVAFSTLNGDIAPHVPGCPSAVVTQYIRRVVTDLCERAKVWRVQLTPQLLVAGDYDYAFVSPVAETEVSSILSAKVATAEGATSLVEVTGEQVLQMYPLWPDTASPGYPLYVSRVNTETYQVVPVPDALDTYTVSIFAAVRPTLAATEVEETILSEYRRVIFHGVVHELMTLPGKSWSNEKLALYHGKQWEYFLYSARAKANKGFGRSDIQVTPVSW